MLASVEAPPPPHTGTPHSPLTHPGYQPPRKPNTNPTTVVRGGAQQAISPYLPINNVVKIDLAPSLPSHLSNNIPIPFPISNLNLPLPPLKTPTLIKQKHPRHPRLPHRTHPKRPRTPPPHINPRPNTAPQHQRHQKRNAAIPRTIPRRQNPLINKQIHPRGRSHRRADLSHAQTAA